MLLANHYNGTPEQIITVTVLVWVELTHTHIKTSDNDSVLYTNVILLCYFFLFVPSKLVL